MKALLQEMLHAVHAINDVKHKGQKRSNTPTLDRFEDARKEILRQEYRYHCGLDLKHGPPIPPPSRVGPKQHLGKNLRDALHDRRAEVLRFIDDFEVPFANNGAERDIRMFKIKMKISGCFRKIHTTEGFSKIRGFISTARKQGVSVFRILRSTVIGPVWIHNGLAAAMA